ncbi:CoA binding domain-containing protein [Lipomyces doorenjongii]
MITVTHQSTCREIQRRFCRSATDYPGFSFHFSITCLQYSKISIMSIEPLRQFFSARAYAVVGASPDPTKYGNKVLKWYIDHKLPATGINPREVVIYGVQSLPSVSALLNESGAEHISVSVITPPRVSKMLLKEINELGDKVKGVWFQPGSFDDATLDAARDGLNVIAGGRCVLVEGENGLRAVANL